MKSRQNPPNKQSPNTRVSEFRSFQSAIASAAGKNRTTLHFSQLISPGDYKNMCIIGKIEYMSEIKSRPNNSQMRKCLLTDASRMDDTSDDKKLSVFLFDRMAACSDVAEIGSYMVIMDFHVEKLTLSANHVQGMALLPVQVLVKNTSELCIMRKRTVVEESSETDISERAISHSDSLDFAVPSTSTGLQHSAAPPVSSQVLPKSDHREQRKRKVENSQAPSDIIDETEDFETDAPSPPSARKKKKQQLDIKTNAAQRTRSPPRSRSARSPPRNQRSPSKAYKYTRLDLLTATNDPKQNFNVFGLVEECNLKMIQKPHSSVLNLLISDQTKKDFGVIVYVSSDETPPDVHPGDVVRLHRMMVENVRNTLKGKCLSAKGVLIFSRKDKGENPKSTAKTFTFTTADRIDAKNMFNWAEQRNWKLISDIRVGDSANVLCQVISVYLPRSSDSVLLTIWDGTKNEDLIVEQRSGLVQNEDPSLMKIAKDYAAKIWVNGPYTLAASELKPAQFIEMRDIEMYCPKGVESSGNPTLVLRPPFKSSRGVFVVDDNDGRLLDLKARLDGIIEESFQNPQSEDDLSFLLNCGILDPQMSSQESSVASNKGSSVASNKGSSVASNKGSSVASNKESTVASKKTTIEEYAHESDESTDTASTLPQHQDDYQQLSEDETIDPAYIDASDVDDKTREASIPPSRMQSETSTTSTVIDKTLEEDVPLMTRVEVTGRKEPAYVMRKSVPKTVTPPTMPSEDEESMTLSEIEESQRIRLHIRDHSYSTPQTKTSTETTASSSNSSVSKQQAPQSARQIADKEIVSILSASILPGQPTQGFGNADTAPQILTQQPEATQSMLIQGQVLSQFISTQRQGVSQFIAHNPQLASNAFAASQLVGSQYLPTSQPVGSQHPSTNQFTGFNTQPSSQYIPFQPISSQVPQLGQPFLPQYNPLTQRLSLNQTPSGSQFLAQDAPSTSQYISTQPLPSSQFILSQVPPSSQAVGSRYGPRTQFVSSQIPPASQLAATQQRVNMTQPDTFVGLSQLQPTTNLIPMLPFHTGNTQGNLAEVAISSTRVHSNVPYSKISEVLSHDVPYKFRILTTVLSFQPETSSIAKLIRLYCPKCHYLTNDVSPHLPIQNTINGINVYHCPNCINWSIASTSSSNGISQLEYTFLVSFSMQDGMDSGAIDVFVWKEDAVKLFKGITPEQALTDDKTADALFELLWDICPNSRPMGTGGDSISDNSPWMTYPVMDCCIKSYTAGGVTRYQMFDTVLT